MTKSSLSWIEPQAMATLLARVSTPPRRRAEILSTVSNKTPASLLPSSTSFIEAPRSRTLPPPMLPAPSMTDPLSSMGRLPDFERPSGSLEERLSAFLVWVNRSIAPLSAFVADESGLPMAALAEDALVAVTAPCMAIFKYLWTLSGGEPRGRLVLVVDTERLLHVAEVATPWGRFNVSLLAQSIIPDATMMTIQRGLATALSEQE